MKLYSENTHEFSTILNFYCSIVPQHITEFFLNHWQNAKMLVDFLNNFDGFLVNFV